MNARSSRDDRLAEAAGIGAAVFAHWPSVHGQPPIDVLAFSNRIWIRLAAPGLAVADLRIKVMERSVIIVSRGALRKPPRDAQLLRIEIPEGRFRLRIELPWSADPERIDIRARHGIIDLSLVRMGIETERPAWETADDDS
jgi:HSP20 family molecular chaperone IbpA